MTPPKHLWSGDWREDSAAAAEALRRRRPDNEQQLGDEAPTEVRALQAQPQPKAPASPAVPPRRAVTPPPAPSRPLAPTPQPSATAPPTSRRGVRALVVFSITALIVAGGAIALSKALGGGTNKPALTGSSRPWLGVQMEDLPVGGVTVTTVFPNGPADNAGVSPGDIITQVDNRSVSTTADVNAALSGLHAGQQVEIQLQRGPLTYTTEATLATWPSGSP